VFELGSSLREARERRGLQLGDVERDTRIRSRYLRALEEERFDIIPGWVYAKGFLRTYADYLGLDADRFVDELTSRLPKEEEDLPPPPAPVRRPRISAPGVLLTFGATAIVAAGLIWVLGAATGSRHRTVSTPPPPPTGRTVAPQLAPPAMRPEPIERTATLVLRASSGRCWIEARAGSQSGAQLYYATLEQGQSLRLSKKRLWLRLGAPSALVATLNGKTVALPPTSDPVDVFVTQTGVQPAA
jgi:Helix-turn-helix domain/RodZ C-terminal domain